LLETGYLIGDTGLINNAFRVLYLVASSGKFFDPGTSELRGYYMFDELAKAEIPLFSLLSLSSRWGERGRVIREIVRVVREPLEVAWAWIYEALFLFLTPYFVLKPSDLKAMEREVTEEWPLSFLGGFVDEIGEGWVIVTEKWLSGESALVSLPRALPIYFEEDQEVYFLGRPWSRGFSAVGYIPSLR